MRSTRRRTRGRSPRARSSPTRQRSSAKAPRLSPPVDLRVRGAAVHRACSHGSHTGRSPRARSSHEVNSRARESEGSISACAEQPVLELLAGCLVGVDLRVRGAASRCGASGRWTSGRSPRARSSRRAGGVDGRRHRSISACAEQPRAASPCTRPRRVDLRVRGAASAKTLSTSRPMGRSPRARSSRRLKECINEAMGSISACAEQPHADHPPRRGLRVDLRVRGAATSTRRL